MSNEHTTFYLSRLILMHIIKTWNLFVGSAHVGYQTAEDSSVRYAKLFFKHSKKVVRCTSLGINFDLASTYWIESNGMRPRKEASNDNQWKHIKKLWNVNLQYVYA